MKLLYNTIQRNYVNQFTIFKPTLISHSTRAEPRLWYPPTQHTPTNHHRELTPDAALQTAKEIVLDPAQDPAAS